jgi:hypothetical protein
LHSDFDTENVLDDRAVLDTMRNEEAMTMTVALKPSFGRICKTIRDRGKISRAVLDHKVLQKVL